jgi:ribose transport system permease protein
MLKKTYNFVRERKLLVIIVVLIATLGLEDPNFLTLKSLYSIFDHLTINGIMAAGMTVLLISGSFDLSIGSVMSFTGIVIVLFQKYGMLASVLCGLAVGTCIGALNGLLVVKGRINAFIVTLGTMIIFRGFGLAVTDSHPVKGTIEAFQVFGQDKILNIPLPVFYLIAAYVAVWYILKYTRFGRNDYAIGGNVLSARLAGIDVNLLTFLYFVFCSFTAAVSGVILTSRVNTGSAVFGDNTSLVVIAAAVLGGTSLFGGRGTIVGTLQGVLILGLIERAMVTFNVDTNFQLLVRGSIILAVVVADALTSGRSKAAAAEAGQ